MEHIANSDNLAARATWTLKERLAELNNMNPDQILKINHLRNALKMRRIWKKKMKELPCNPKRYPSWKQEELLNKMRDELLRLDIQGYEIY